MTGPLAQQIAQVRSGVMFDRFNSDGTISSLHTNALAALSAIERHVQDMETALRAIEELGLQDQSRTRIARSALRGHGGHIHSPGHFCGSNCPMYHVAALPARERLRRHPDAWSERAFDQQKARAEAAEAEVQRLREERDAQHRVTENVYGLLVDAKRQRNAAEASVQRLTEGLREIAEARVEYRRDGHGFSHHLLDKDGNYLGSAAPKLQDMSRALLSASPTGGGGA